MLGLLTLAGILFGGVIAAFAVNPGLPEPAWMVTKGGGCVLMVLSCAAFLMLKRACEDLDAPRIERATALCGGGFIIAALMLAGIQIGGWLRTGGFTPAAVVPALAMVALSCCCWLLVARRRFSRAQPEALPPLPAPPASAPARAAGTSGDVYVPVSVARRSGHAGAVMDADSAEWWRRINGDGSWN